MKSSNSNQWQQPQTNLRHDIPISRKVLWNKTKISKVSSSSAEDYKSWEPNLVQQLSDYIQDRSILKTHPYRVWDINNLRFIPTLKNPCFFVKALGDNETRYRYHCVCFHYLEVVNKFEICFGWHLI